VLFILTLGGDFAPDSPEGRRAGEAFFSPAGAWVVRGGAFCGERLGDGLLREIGPPWGEERLDFLPTGCLGSECLASQQTRGEFKPLTKRTSTADQLLVRQMNMALLLDALRQARSTSRARLAAQVGLNRSTVSSIITELLEMGLVRETELQGSKNGRPGMLLELNPNAGARWEWTSTWISSGGADGFHDERSVAALRDVESGRSRAGDSGAGAGVDCRGAGGV
jgi:DNA-binding MarR family transcriptional regulator